MIPVQPAYQTSDQVNTVLRPNRSAAWPKATTPNHNPIKVQNTKLPNPAIFMPFKSAKNPRDCGLNNPVFTMPGAT
jgi:hypothetical protein